MKSFELTLKYFDFTTDPAGAFLIILNESLMKKFLYKIESF